MTERYWNREELYEKVWNQPATRVAKEFGVSDVAIAKVCRKLIIPLPRQGYWAKKAYGHAVSRKPCYVAVKDFRTCEKRVGCGLNTLAILLSVSFTVAA